MIVVGICLGDLRGGKGAIKGSQARHGILHSAALLGQRMTLLAHVMFGSVLELLIQRLRLQSSESSTDGVHGQCDDEVEKNWVE